MALSLKGSETCNSGDQVTPFLNRLVSCGVGHQVMPGVTAKGDLLPPTEYEKHVEHEQWSKMINDRSKDLVLTFGENDVRVFRRIGHHAKKGKLPSHLDSQDVPSADADDAASPAPPQPNTSATGNTRQGGVARQDVSGLATIGNPKVFTSTSAPRCVEERARELERIRLEGEAKAERQRRLDAESGISGGGNLATVSSRPTTSDSSNIGTRVGQVTTPESHQLASETRSRRGDGKRLLPLKKATLAKVDPASAVSDPSAPPPFIPPRMFAQLILRRCREADPAQGAAHLAKLRQEQVEAKDAHSKPRHRHHRIGCVHHRLSTNTLARSMARERTFPAKALNQSVLRLRQAIHGAPSSTTIDDDPSADPDACFAPPEISHIESSHPLDLTTRTPPVGNESFLDGASFIASDHNESLAEGVDVFSLTRPNMPSVLERSKTPNLEPFNVEEAANHIPMCECTDRSSTDEEEPLREQIRNARRVLHKKGKPLRAEPRVADRAAESLFQWTAGFNQAKVAAGVRLESRLAKREEHREFVCNERRHLHLVATAAEKCGEEFYLSRQCRTTTPSGASMWAPVHSAIEGDRRYVSLAQGKYGEFANFCASKRFPQDNAEALFMEDLRQRCVEDASSRPASGMYGDVTRASATNHSRSTPDRRRGSVKPPSAIVVLEANANDRADIALRRIVSDASPSAELTADVQQAHRRPSRVTTVSLSETYRVGSSGNNAPSGSRSVFLPSSRDRSSQASWRVEAPKAVRVLNEATATELLERHGATLLATRRGVAVANQLREMCELSPKDFFALVQSREAQWGPFIPEVAHLRKKLQA